ncbi:hypothetical protein PILCRDRAFT_694774 [Piloderma croceum F 1598]|uniref:Uncharacterized protein n=1 Tax=Piloderma croceum (strain F 1598) TaxID=765440 RepID=A0A0C3F4K3_PILCF|nr:hypothetical protein PILCRDRAFT_694774 [Piloderma croceum F 1598]
MTRRIFFILEIVVLWLTLGMLAIITSMALVASSTRSDCDSPITNITITSNACTPRERLSATVYHHASYFQSTHIILIHAVATFSLIVFKPSLWAMAWSALESSSQSNTGAQGLTMKMSAFQSGVGLGNSPGLIPSVLYTKASGSLMPHVAFVLVVSLLSLLSPIAVSTIYQSHQGAFNVSASIVNGGGVGPTLSPSFSSTDIIPIGIAAGRALISAATILNSTISPAVFNISVAPFIPRDTIQAIWYTQIETVIARNSLDCSSSAPLRLSNSSQDFVTLDDMYYFAPNQSVYEVQPSFAGQILGPITNDPDLTVVYLNRTVTASPGVVEAQTSVIFLAANGTLEGAQQRITSPEPTSRIEFVDVLVCTSTTRLEISICTIDMGAVRSCDFSQPTNLSSSSTTGGVEIYIGNPEAVAITLSASPVTACYILSNRLPMYGINEQDISTQVPPISYLSLQTFDTIYNIPLTYVTDVLFAKTAQGLVQGMVSTWSNSTNQSVSLITTFGTSSPVLLYVILALSVAWALSATLASILPRSARQAAPLDVARLLAISRNPELNTVLEPYSDKSVEMDDELLSAGVGYGWDENLNQHVLRILPRWRNQDVSVTAIDSTSAVTLSQRRGGVIGSGVLKEYSAVESEAD